MKKQLKEYIESTEKLLKEENCDFRLLREEYFRKISFFQHERLIHLIVTVTFAILGMISFGVFLFSGEKIIGILLGLLIVLLIPYIFHYYALENGVQRMYAQYDEITERMKNTEGWRKIKWRKM
ncbi:MAG: hypothetical protein J6M02_05560 [Clostridia bacterium]|nr:hypothetical protein [Clostridia bacterium]